MKRLFSENAWIMTRQRLAPGTVLQRAYGVLDRFKINRAFFVKTDQAECHIAEAVSENDINKEGADKDKEDAEKNRRNKNNERENVKSATDAVAEPVAADKEQLPAEPKKPLVTVESVVKQEQPAPVKSDVASATEEKQSSPIEAIKEPVVAADPIPVKQTSIVAETVKKQ